MQKCERCGSTNRGNQLYLGKATHSVTLRRSHAFCRNPNLIFPHARFSLMNSVSTFPQEKGKGKEFKERDKHGGANCIQVFRVYLLKSKAQRHGVLKLGLFLKHYPPQGGRLYKWHMFEFLASFGRLCEKDCKYFVLLLHICWQPVGGGACFPTLDLSHGFRVPLMASYPMYPYVGLVCKVGNSMAWPFSPLFLSSCVHIM